MEFQVERRSSDALRVAAPPHRLDIQEGPADLIEDLARLHGYDRLPATLLADRLPPQTGNPALEFEERVRDLFDRRRPSRDDQLRPDHAGARGTVGGTAGRIRPPAQSDQQRALGDAAERVDQCT